MYFLTLSRSLKKKKNQSGDIETWNQTNLKIVKNREKQIEMKKRKKES